MALNSRLRTIFHCFIDCVRSCRKDQVKQQDLAHVKTIETGEEAGGTQTAADSEQVQTYQPTGSHTQAEGSSVDSPKCFVHKEQNHSIDTVSEISSEELTEFGELLNVPEEVEEDTQEVIQTVSTFGCIETLPTICESHREVIPTVTEPEVQYSVTSETEYTETVPQEEAVEETTISRETNNTEESSGIAPEQQTVPSKMEAVEKVTSGVQLPSDLDEVSLMSEGQDLEDALNFDPSNFDPSSISSLVEQLQAPLDDVERQVSTDEVDFQNTNGSQHASLEAADALEAALAESLNGVDLEPVDEKPRDGDNKGDDPKAKKEKTKEEKKSKKKEDKTIDHILRALSSLHTTEEKLAALCKKYADLHEEHRVLQTSNKQNTRKLSVVSREKDQLQSEHTKAVMAKSKLESLCRELQKHNQVIRQESLQRAREEDEKRKEISNKFQTTITEIQQQMTDHHERNQKLREENQELAGKLKKFIEQYEMREKQVEKVMQHRELEQKLADAKLAQSNAILKEEQERNKKEKELLVLQATEGQKKATLLEAQLAMYKERYEEFQSTINKSNEMFQKFKTEMDKMTKRIKKLEKDGAQWKQKWENSNKALIEMAEEKTLYDREKPLLMGKIKKLESLCRAMQAERLGRKVLEASSLDPSKFEETLAASQGVEKQIQTQLHSASLQQASQPQESSEGGRPDSPANSPNCDKEEPSSASQTDDTEESGSSEEQTDLPSQSKEPVESESTNEEQEKIEEWEDQLPSAT
ncbi:alpha-taxilin-like isoform X2 [Mizuhopecten yessoensis]|uniref:alpha-taxilin-like isoform X2 n=1 Tax=Mizuhopecten yessoensis TaxID=6573 RepID=UPI000B45E955|nr:alpha-taxilin-like isoform X2 [Mizuhopecten yessoensis]